MRSINSLGEFLSKKLFTIRLDKLLSNSLAESFILKSFNLSVESFAILIFFTNKIENHNEVNLEKNPLKRIRIIGKIINKKLNFILSYLEKDNNNAPASWSRGRNKKNKYRRFVQMKMKNKNNNSPSLNLPAASSI
jgi:hypothetical protein